MDPCQNTVRTWDKTGVFIDVVLIVSTYISAFLRTSTTILPLGKECLAKLPRYLRKVHTKADVTTDERNSQILRTDTIHL